jgi:hypothetical protein
VRAQEFCAFLLTLTYIDVAYPEVMEKIADILVGYIAANHPE